MTHIPFDPEFDTHSTLEPEQMPSVDTQQTGSFPSGLAFVAGLITALVAGSLLANALLIKLLIK
ncbi:MAG: hypothetical protein UX10_C0002G0027 [Candidatus Magasanikbacteria bacterium GW2011_GWA2_45_39]|uniref:Uncharacterized protein n=2 Tax=Candidatus Magasanikiibacteriota TaxID=1752731 RepID=A0A0G1QYB9_9BACT|nr:MAG: hypothetical protein UX10_C0002G0027 [Candidatus Magasanikbacteria bacterium GW2011_GWA2_45_39]KKU13660.1 MAG: hypothetical protein UX20_C0016G0008 [Candidatus Magasanikbacteria bacterium GW2011_GWC2_45_8]HBW74268.1 hypothetical protein [Candidatus Magasanikbacteria bacterium]